MNTNKKEMNASAHSAFNRLAESYDREFSDTPIGKLQRKRVWRFLHPVLHRLSDKNILEINSGTGEDAILMASLGYTVTATDIAAGMTKILLDKINKNQRFNIRAFTAGFDQLSETLKGKGSYDLVVSDFGGLNCVNEQALEKLSADLDAITEPDASLFLVCMGTQCAWEKWVGILKKKPELKNRRKGGGRASANINGESIPVWYYSPARLATIFGKEFRPTMVWPIGLFIPPSYMTGYFKNKRILLNILNVMEMIFGFSWLANRADHYLLVLKKNKS